MSDLALPAVGLFGPPGLFLEVLEHLLASNDVPLFGRSSDACEVGVLVEPAPEHWDEAATKAGRLVLVVDREVGDLDLIRGIELGADAVLPGNVNVTVLLEAVKVVAAGGAYLTPRQTRLLAERVRNQGAGVVPPPLSPREADVLASIAQGDSIKQTAARLGIAAKTVENVQSRLFRKLGVRNRAQAVAHAHSVGLLDVGDPRAC